MKIGKTASGKTAIKISKSEWIAIGNKASWLSKKSFALPLEDQLKEKGRLNEFDDRYWEVANYLNHELPKDIVDKIEKEYPNLSVLGAGADGIAYDIGDGRVLKLTFNLNEKKTADALINNPSPYFCKVYRSEYLEGTCAKMIIMEKCQRLDRGFLYKNLDALLKEIERLKVGAAQFIKENNLGTLFQNEIKANNIGINKDGRYVIIDLGISF